MNYFLSWFDFLSEWYEMCNEKQPSVGLSLSIHKIKQFWGVGDPLCALLFDDVVCAVGDQERNTVCHDVLWQTLHWDCRCIVQLDSEDRTLDLLVWRLVQWFFACVPLASFSTSKLCPTQVSMKMNRIIKYSIAYFFSHFPFSFRLRIAESANYSCWLPIKLCKYPFRTSLEHHSTLPLNL